jgi:hypothetical protein
MVVGGAAADIGKADPVPAMVNRRISPVLAATTGAFKQKA